MGYLGSTHLAQVLCICVVCVYVVKDIIYRFPTNNQCSQYPSIVILDVCYIKTSSRSLLNVISDGLPNGHAESP